MTSAIRSTEALKKLKERDNKMAKLRLASIMKQIEKVNGK
jgi:hypothetical protein